jgi:hypothetical protein
VQHALDATVIRETNDAGVDEADSAMPLGRMEDHADHETEADTGSAPP